ncbi:MAG: glycosyltransferase [Candidatus Omnitrophica bacterium]|nr:glycosyltransferase [Candidatus Omnitrophota bacterium]MDD5429994.1 glycosyltransferase [Candidatus Omnitrophota bacterium]
MAQKPFFSVVVPTYNRADFLKIAIESVLTQTFKNYELLIVDDGSIDNTAENIKSQVSNSKIQTKIKYFYQKNRGPAAARNKGIKNSNGEFICFLDSDDRWTKDKLNITFDYTKKHPDCKIFHSEEIWYRNGCLLTPRIKHKKPSGNVFTQALKLCCLGISTAAIHASVFKSLGGFDEYFPACEDYEFWLRASLKYQVTLIPEYLTIKEGGHRDQQSKKYEAMDIFRIQALKKFLERETLPPEKYNAAYNELKLKCLIYIQGALKRQKPHQVKKYQEIVNNLNPDGKF